MKTLYRSNSNKMLFGVCGGIGEYLAVDPTVIRVVTIALGVLSGGIFLLAYILCLFVIPSDPKSN